MEFLSLVWRHHTIIYMDISKEFIRINFYCDSTHIGQVLFIVYSIYSIFHSIFKCMIFQRRQKALLWSKGLRCSENFRSKYDVCICRIHRFKLRTHFRNQLNSAYTICSFFLIKVSTGYGIWPYKCTSYILLLKTTLNT